MRALLGTAAIVVLLGVGAGVASGASECSECTASYSGTWTVSTPGHEFVSLTFSESLQSGEWSLTNASGSYTEPAEPENHYPGCDATLTANASAASMLGSFGPSIVIRRSGSWTAELFPPTYWGATGDPVNSSVVTGDCATSARVDYAGLGHGLEGAQCHLDPTAGGTQAIEFPVGSSYTVPDDCSGTVTSNGVDYDVTLQSSVTFSSPGVVSPGSSGPVGSGGPPYGPDPYGPFFRPAKEAAGRDLRMHAIPNAVQFCLPFATGSLLTGSGVILSGLPGGLELTLAGAVTAYAAAPFCAATIGRLISDYRAFNDPPRKDFDVIARPSLARAVALPSCGRFHGAAARFCSLLRTTESRWVAAARSSASVAAAIEATVSREHAAAIAGQKGAVTAQDVDLRTLLSDLQRTTATEAVAGRAITRVFRRAHLRLRLTEPQSARVIAIVDRRVTAQGVPAANLSSVDPAAFQPHQRDLLAALNSL